MLDRGDHVCLCRVVAGELVRDHHTRHAGLPLQQLAKQALGGLFVAPALDENVEHEAILVDGPPEPVLRSADHQAHFVEVPLVSRVWQLAADLVSEALAELARPLPHGLSWLTTMPRAASISSTMRRLSGKRKYSQTAWLMTSPGKR